jgi:hypothetical protein
MRSPKQTPTTKPAKAQAADAQATKPNGGQDAEALLKADHRAVEALFEKYEGETSATRKAEIAEEICTQLIVHSTIEEEIFYPACREKNIDHDMLDEAQVEHDGVKVLVAELKSEEPDEEFYDAKVAVLSEYVKHHVGEEEKPSDGIFAKAKSASIDMSALGQRLQARKEQLMAKAEATGLRSPMPRSLQFRAYQQPPNRQEYGNVDRRSQYRDRDDQGRFMSDDGDRGYSRGSSGRSQYRERDDQGRFMNDDDDRGYSRASSGRSQYHERDDQGRFMSGDDDRGYSRGSSGRSQYRERDDQGRFMSDDDDRGYSRGSSGRSQYRERNDQGRFMSDDDDRGYSRGSSDRSQYRERDDQGRFMSGDDDRGDARSRGYGRRDDDSDDRRGYSSRGRGHGGWYGDPEGHSDASQRGWEERGSRSARRYADDDDGRRGSSGSPGHGGWFGDPAGHSEAAERGWEHRGAQGGRRYEDDDDGRRRGSSSRGRGHGGWFGDPEGHSQASRRGWRDRD